MAAVQSAQAEFLALSGALKGCRGDAFEDHGHPSVLLDRVTSPSVRVWGWWAKADPRFPCLLWCSERGWSATVVEPDEVDGPGYDLRYWSHRIRLLDVALANALGPHRSLGILELFVSADTTLHLGSFGVAVRESLLWGIVQLRRARALGAGSRLIEAPTSGAGFVDDELVRHALIPTQVKSRNVGSPWSGHHKDPSVDSLIRALAESGHTGNAGSADCADAPCGD